MLVCLFAKVDNELALQGALKAHHILIQETFSEINYMSLKMKPIVYFHKAFLIILLLCFMDFLLAQLQTLVDCLCSNPVESWAVLGSETEYKCYFLPQ